MAYVTTFQDFYEMLRHCTNILSNNYYIGSFNIQYLFYSVVDVHAEGLCVLVITNSMGLLFNNNEPLSALHHAIPTLPPQF